MRIVITGSPGVGKTAVARLLGKKLKYKVLNEKEFALEKSIGKWDPEDNELVVPLSKLKIELNKVLSKEKNLIVEGHMLCELGLKADVLVLMRLHPELLYERLALREYSAEKIGDNVFCEGIDYCKKHASRNYAKKKIIEVKCQKSIKETVHIIIKEFKERGLLE